MLVKSRIKYIQSLGQKKFRDESGMYVAEGPKLVEELLNAIPADIVQVLALNDWIEGHRSLLHEIDFIEITDIELEKISQLPAPNQVLAVLRQKEPLMIESSQGKVSLVLDDVRDPGNMGTILRIADWFGVSQIICSLQCAEIYNPKVVQSSMGSIARVTVYYTDLESWLKKQKEVAILAAVLGGKELREFGQIKEGILIIGNESRGIDPVIASLASQRITIPRRGKAESLNAAVATGIILSHII